MASRNKLLVVAGDNYGSSRSSTSTAYLLPMEERQTGITFVMIKFVTEYCDNCR